MESIVIFHAGQKDQLHYKRNVHIIQLIFVFLYLLSIYGCSFLVDTPAKKKTRGQEKNPPAPAFFLTDAMKRFLSNSPGLSSFQTGQANTPSFFKSQTPSFSPCR